jgi:hypothetical protein
LIAHPCDDLSGRRQQKAPQWGRAGKSICMKSRLASHLEAYASPAAAQVESHLASGSIKPWDSAMALYPKSLAQNHKKLDRHFR